MKLIGQARSYSDEQPHHIAAVEDMCNMVDRKRQQVSVTFLKSSSVLKSDFIDTSNGVMFTSPKQCAVNPQKVTDTKKLSRKRTID